MINTGIFCTPEELEQVKGKAAGAQLAQMTSSKFGPSRSEVLWEEVWKFVYSLAIKHGLPEIEGFYGMDNDGQFTMTE